MIFHLFSGPDGSVQPRACCRGAEVAGWGLDFGAEQPQEAHCKAGKRLEDQISTLKHSFDSKNGDLGAYIR